MLALQCVDFGNDPLNTRFGWAGVEQRLDLLFQRLAFRFEYLGQSVLTLPFLILSRDPIGDTAELLHRHPNDRVGEDDEACRRIEADDMSDLPHHSASSGGSPRAFGSSSSISSSSPLSTTIAKPTLLSSKSGLAYKFTRSA